MRGRRRPDRRLIVGLGNPGPRYAQTRHNAGFMVVQRLIRRWAIALRRGPCSSTLGEGEVGGRKVGVAQPQAFMNASGKPIRCLLNRWNLRPSCLLVVCDDVSLPLGSIRLRAQGSDGGHLGLASVLQELGTHEVPRLRVGIRTEQAQPVRGDLTEFVLGRFGPSEEKPLELGLGLAVQACELWLSEGLSEAMNRFNRRVLC